MIFFSWQEILWIVFAAIVLDWLIGDPKILMHPVSIIGKCIRFIDRTIHDQNQPASIQRIKGIFMVVVICSLSFLVMWVFHLISLLGGLWLSYALHTWFISTTIACKGLKDAAYEVIKPLLSKQLKQARTAVSMIVGRDTNQLDESQVVRATIETVAENTVDAFISPVIYALIGGAPLAILYRATNTLDSMVGYKNERYLMFGWASARLDDLLNFLPARLTGFLLCVAAFVLFGKRSFMRSVHAIRQYAHLHPSPNSGIPESAVAGALHIQLGGTNTYGGVISKRPFLGEFNQPMRVEHIYQTVRMFHMIRYFVVGGILCLLCWQLFNF